MANLLYDHLFAPHAENPACFLSQPSRPDLSYADFIAMAASLAHVLVSHGVQPGDRVVVQAPKCVEMVGLYAATIQAGAVFLPLNTAYKQEELTYFVGDATPRIIVCDEGSQDALIAIAADVGATVLTLNADGSGNLTASLSDHFPVFKTVDCEADNLAALLYTSGTTGRSKGAMLTHKNLLSNAASLVNLWKITSDDTLIHALPIFHTHGLFVALNTSLLAGATVNFLPAFELDAILGALPGSTLLMGVPTFYTRLLTDDRLTRERTANIRLFVSGSAPLLAETHTAFTARTGHYILERYGMTETNMITSNPYSGERRAGTVGTPLTGVEVRLTDPGSGDPITENTVGMIEVRGPNVFKGYWRMPEKTAAEFRSDGFFITGDLGELSEDGYLSIVGRAKDLIITGGYNVYPKELEDVLNSVTGVKESAVYGVPDADFGEAIIAAIVTETEVVITPDNLAVIVAEKLARFKHPRRYQFVERLPRNAMGKVQKNRLREEFIVNTS